MYLHPKLISDFKDIETALQNAFDDQPKSATIAIDAVKKILFGKEDEIIPSIYQLRFHMLKCFSLPAGGLSVNFVPDNKHIFKKHLQEIRMLFVFETRTRFGYKYSSEAIAENLEVEKKIIAELYKKSYHFLITKPGNELFTIHQIWAGYVSKKRDLINNTCK